MNTLPNKQFVGIAFASIFLSLPPSEAASPVASFSGDLVSSSQGYDSSLSAGTYTADSLFYSADPYAVGNELTPASDYTGPSLWGGIATYSANADSANFRASSTGVLNSGSTDELAVGNNEKNASGVLRGASGVLLVELTATHSYDELTSFALTCSELKGDTRSVGRYVLVIDGVTYLSQSTWGQGSHSINDFSAESWAMLSLVDSGHDLRATTAVGSTYQTMDLHGVDLTSDSVTHAGFYADVAQSASGARAVIKVSSFSLAAEAGSPEPDPNDLDGDGMENDVETGFGREPNGADYGRIPFAESFEAYSGQLLVNNCLWNGTAGALSIDTVDAAAGSQSLKLVSSDDTVKAYYLLVDNGSRSTWTSFQLKPQWLSAAPELDAQATCSFYFNDSGKLVIYDRFYWKELDHTPVTVDTWQQLAIFHDYINHRWSLWLNGSEVANSVQFAPYAHADFIAGVQACLSEAGSANWDALTVDSLIPTELSGVGETYSTWAANYSWALAGDDAATANPDGDAWTNLEEFGRGSNPLLADGGGVEPVAESGRFVFRLQRSLLTEGLSYEFETSPDLSNWTAAPELATTAEVLADDGSTQTVEFSTALGTAPWFVRIMLSQP